MIRMFKLLVSYGGRETSSQEGHFAEIAAGKLLLLWPKEGKG
jgi:hypothetical protein